MTKSFRLLLGAALALGLAVVLSRHLTATIAPTARDAAQYYPASYWLSLLRIPDAKEFPGTGPQGNGIAPTVKSQAQFIGELKERCMLCHQLGNKATREIPKEYGLAG